MCCKGEQTWLSVLLHRSQFSMRGWGRHTLSIPVHKWRLLAKCHAERNLALYEGAFSADQQLLDELIRIARELQMAIADLRVRDA